MGENDISPANLVPPRRDRGKRRDRPEPTGVRRKQAGGFALRSAARRGNGGRRGSTGGRPGAAAGEGARPDPRHRSFAARNFSFPFVPLRVTLPAEQRSFHGRPDAALLEPRQAPPRRVRGKGAKDHPGRRFHLPQPRRHAEVRASAVCTPNGTAGEPATPPCPA